MSRPGFRYRPLICDLAISELAPCHEDGCRGFQGHYPSTTLDKSITLLDCH